MNSMTGFGRAEVKDKLGKWTVEISTVNNRYLELSVRLPRHYASIEPRVREFLGSAVSRGKVNTYVGVEELNQSPEDYIINKNAVRAYVRQLDELRGELKLAGDLTIADLMSLPEVVSPCSAELDLELVWKRVGKGLQRAVSQMLAMRAKEGRAMAADMRKRLNILVRIVRQIEKKTADSVRTYAVKLTARIGQLLESPICDSIRLEEEIALFAERTDITEECIRFKSHIEQYKAAMGAKDPVGRRLNFILQEMNREVNTIGAKSADFGISSDVISLKEEIEKLREMVQNVE